MTAHRARRRRDDRHSGRRQLGRRRLCHRDAFPSRRRPGIAHAGARHRRQMAGRRSRRQKLDVSLGTLEKTRRADAVHTGLGDRRGAGDRRLCHGRRRRCRHSQPHPLRGARSRELVLRPAHARPRDPRPLRPPDRRFARCHRQAAHRRRRRPMAAQGSPPTEKLVAFFSGP